MAQRPYRAGQRAGAPASAERAESPDRQGRAVACQRSAKGTLHPGEALSQHMRIDLRGAHIGVAQQGLNRADIATPPQQLRGEGMAKRMTTGRLAYRGTAHRPPHGLLHRGRMEMVAYEGARCVPA